MNDCSSMLEVLNEKGFLGWEEAIEQVVNEYGCKLSENLFERIDEYLLKERDSSLRCLGYRVKTIFGRHGQINIKRRYYKDRSGRYRFLLDEALGLEKRRAATPAVSRFAATLAAHVPFRVAESLLARAFGSDMSHQSIHNLVARIGEDRLIAEEIDRIKLFDLGELPKTQKKAADTLFVEADGVGIALQRQKTKRAEVKVGVAYSSKVSGKTKDKTIHLDLSSGDSFWQGFSTKIAGVFDPARVKKVTIGGDGAPWIRIGQKLYAGAAFRLDPFHVARAIRSVLGFSVEASEAKRAALSGDVKSAVAILDRAEDGSDKTKQINQVKRYLKNNADGLGHGPSLGTIESNVDKLVANRMKKRGMSWTAAGARRMLKLLEANHLSTVDDMFINKDLPALPKHQKAQVVEALTREPDAITKAHVAAFDGPHSSRPWVKLLREIVRGDELKLTGFVPTRS